MSEGVCYFWGMATKLKKGMFVYKRLQVTRNSRSQYSYAVAKLWLPKGTSVVLFDGHLRNDRKCRASRAKVVSIRAVSNPYASNPYASNPYASPALTPYRLKRAMSLYQPSGGDFLIYEVGKMVYPDSFNDSRGAVCTNGLHFFQTEEDALHYQLY